MVEARSEYLRKYPNRGYSTTIRDNKVYEKQLSNLQCDNLEKYKEEAKEQAKFAVENTLKKISYIKSDMRSKRHIREKTN